MKKIIYLFIGIWALFGAQYSFAQEFDFSCEPDCSRIVSIQEGLVLNNAGQHLHGSAIIGVTIQNGDSTAAILDGRIIPEGAVITGLRIEDGSGIGAGFSLAPNETITYSCENGFVVNDELLFTEIPICDRTVSVQAGLTLNLPGNSYHGQPITHVRGGAVSFAQGQSIPDAIGASSILLGNGEFIGLDTLGSSEDEIYSCENGFVLNSNLPWATGPSNDFDISHLTDFLPERYSELTSITVPGFNDNQYYYVWHPYLAYRANNNGWSIRRDTNNKITGIKLGFTGDSGDQSFVEITSTNQNSLIAAALHAAAHRYGDDDAEIISGVTYSNNYELEILGIDEFDTGRGERFYAIETDQFTKAHDDNSNMSVIDLTPLSVIDGFNTRNDFTTTSRSSLFVTRGQAIAGEWYAIKTSDRIEVVEIVNVTQDTSGKDFAIFDGSDLTASIPSRTAVSVWQIADPTGFGIIRVSSTTPVAISFGYSGYYDLRGQDLEVEYIDFDGNNGNSHILGEYYGHVAEDAASGNVASRSHLYTANFGSSRDQSQANWPDRSFGTTAGNVVLMRGTGHLSVGYGVYISRGIQNGHGLYRSLWYSHDVVMDFSHDYNNDFRSKRVPNAKLPSTAAFIR